MTPVEEARSMGAWDVIERATEYETGWYTGGYDLVEQPDGSTKRYYWAELSPAVVIVALHDDQVVFVEQYRPTVGETFLELPAGIVEDGEDFTDAAARELREETGFDPGELSLLQEVWVATGVLRHRRGIVAATDLDPGERSLDGNEFLSVTTRPRAAAVEAARTAPANESTVQGLLLAERDGYLSADAG